MKTLILTHENIGIVYTKAKESQMTQEEASKEMCRGCEIPPHDFPSEEKLEEAKKIEGPF